MKRVVFACLIAAAATLVTIAACKQGEGERCQVDADCDDGLGCNVATNTCQSGGGAQFDAAIIDAVPDVPVEDAPADAAADAAADAP